MATSKREKKAKENSTILPPPNPNLITGLVASNVKSLVAGLTMIITDSSTTYFTAPIKNIFAWKITGNRIELLGFEKVILEFVSASEASTAAIRITEIINGEIVS